MTLSGFEVLTLRSSLLSSARLAQRQGNPLPLSLIVPLRVIGWRSLIQMQWLSLQRTLVFATPRTPSRHHGTLLVPFEPSVPDNRRRRPHFAPVPRIRAHRTRSPEAKHLDLRLPIATARLPVRHQNRTRSRCSQKPCLHGRVLSGRGSAWEQRKGSAGYFTVSVKQNVLCGTTAC